MDKVRLFVSIVFLTLAILVFPTTTFVTRQLQKLQKPVDEALLRTRKSFQRFYLDSEEDKFKRAK